MKKLFISCPVKGRKLEDILKTRKKMHELAQIIFDQELEVIDSTMVREITDGDTIESLIKHLQYLKDADYFVGMRADSSIWPDCWLEADIATRYDIPRYFVGVQDVAKDVLDIEREQWCGETTISCSEA